MTYKGFPRGGRGAVIAALTAGLTFALVASASAAGTQPPASGGAALFGTPSVSISAGHHRYKGDSIHMGDRIIQPGMTGHDVRVLQAFLSMAGFPTAVDGQDGPTTVSNVIAFQRSRGLKPNGIVTWQVSQTPAPGRGGDRHQRTAGPPREARRRPGHRALGRAGSGQGSDRRGQPDRVQAVHLRRRPRQLELGRLRLLGLGQLRAARRRPAQRDRGLDPARVLRRAPARAGGSRSGPTAVTPTCTSRACASTPPRRARPAARAGPRRAPRTPASSSVTPLSTRPSAGRCVSGAMTRIAADTPCGCSQVAANSRTWVSRRLLPEGSRKPESIP